MTNEHLLACEARLREHVYALIEGALLVRAAGLPEDRLATARRAAQQLIRGLQA